MKNFRFITLAVYIFSTVILISSCESDNKNGLGDSRYISLTVSSESTVETKSVEGASTKELPTVELSSVKGESLYILGSISKNTEDPFNNINTKATVLDKNSISNFPVSVYNAGTLYGQGIAQPGDDCWSIYNGTSKIDWPTDCDGKTLSFYSYTDGSDNPEFTFNSETKKFSFQAPSTSDGIKDFLVAYSETTHNHSQQNLVPVHFYHALSLIKFEGSANVTINKITIKKIANKGTLEVKTNYSDFTDVFKWTPDYTSSASYSLTATLNKCDIFVMPQILKDSETSEYKDVELTFNLTTSRGTFELTTKAKNLGVDEWTPGYVYNYVISDSATPNVGIDVIDTMSSDNKIKSNVKVDNTKRSTSYIRAIVIGTWCNDADKVVASWNGTINYNTTDWQKVGNYYYYKYPVVGYTSTTNLVNEFKVENAGVKPTSIFDLHLELRVIAQAVEYDSEKKFATQAWGSTVASILSTNLK